MKIRSGFVSNSSSSSYLIECDSKETAERVMQCYRDFKDYFLKIQPNAVGYGMRDCIYDIATPDEIEAHFTSNNMKRSELKYNMESINEGAKKGYAYLLGDSDSEDCTPEDHIAHTFNDEILPYIHQKNGKEIDAILVFEERWS